MLIGSLSERTGFNEKELDVPAGMTIDGLMALLGIDATWPAVVTRNGFAAAPDEVVAAGDRVVISPVFSGG